MSEFQFQFDKPVTLGPKPSKLETWVLLDSNPELRPNEKESVLYGDAIDKLYVVKPAFLYQNTKNEIGYLPEDRFSYYGLVAQLKKSPYLVLLDEFTKSKQMHEHLLKKHPISAKNTFYLDLFFSPGYGACRPKYVLFEKVQLNVIPSTMVLFREL